jgi:hypothetical protein
MKLSVVPMREPGATAADGLRRIADEIESGVWGETDEVTVVFPGASELFHLGGRDADAGTSALLNVSCAVTKITSRVLTNGSFP